MADATGHIRVETIIDDSLKSGLKGVSDSIFLVSARINGLNLLTRSLTNSNYAVSQSLKSVSSAQSGVTKTSRELAANQAIVANYLKQVNAEAKAATTALRSHQATLSQSSAGYKQAGAEIAFIDQKLRHLNSTQKVVDRTMRANALQTMSKQYNKQATELSYVGQRLTMGLTLPLVTLGRLGFSSLKKLDQELIRTRKLLDDTGDGANDLEGRMKVLGERLDDISYKWGVSRELLQGLAGDFAELGISDPKTLANLVQITNEIEKLGNVDITDAGKLTQSIYQNLLRIRRLQGMSVTDPMALQQITQEVRGAIALFNYAENKTSLSLKNIADAFPEVSGAATSFGLNMATTAALLVPMVSAGFQVGASANSIKVSLQKLVLPTKDTRKLIGALRQELGEDFKMSADIGGKGLQDLVDGYIALEDSVYKTQGTMQLFGKAFGVRQGPRMEVAIQQMAAFQKQLNNAKSSETLVLSTLERSINAQLRKNGLEEVSLKNINGIQELNNASTERSKENNLEYTKRAKIIQGIQRQEAKQLITSEKMRTAMQDISTESGKILIGGAFGQEETGRTMEEELRKSEQSLNVQAGRVRESVKSIARDFTVAFGEILKVVSPIFIKIAKTIRELSPGFKKAIGLAAIFLVTIGPIIRIFSLFKQSQSLAMLGLSKGLTLGRTQAQQLDAQLLKTSDSLLRLGKIGKVTQIGDKIFLEGKAKTNKKAMDLVGLESQYDPTDTSRSSRRTGKEILRLKKQLGIVRGRKTSDMDVSGLMPGTLDALGLNPFTKNTAGATSKLSPQMQAQRQSGIDAAKARAAALKAAAGNAGLISVGTAPSAVTQSVNSSVQNSLNQIVAILQAIENCACNGKNALTSKPQGIPGGGSPAAANAPPFYPTPSGLPIAKTISGFGATTIPAGGPGAPQPGAAALSAGTSSVAKTLDEELKKVNTRTQTYIENLGALVKGTAILPTPVSVAVRPRAAPAAQSAGTFMIGEREATSPQAPTPTPAQAPAQTTNDRLPHGLQVSTQLEGFTRLGNDVKNISASVGVATPTIGVPKGSGVNVGAETQKRLDIARNAVKNVSENVEEQVAQLGNEVKVTTPADVVADLSKTTSNVVEQVVEQVTTQVQEVAKSTKRTRAKPRFYNKFREGVDPRVKKLVDLPESITDRSGVPFRSLPTSPEESYDERRVMAESFKEFKDWFRKSTARNFVPKMGKPTNPFWGRRAFSEARRAARATRSGLGLRPSFSAGTTLKESDSAEFGLLSKEAIEEGKKRTKRSALQAFRESRALPKQIISTSPRPLSDEDRKDFADLEEAKKKSRVDPKYKVDPELEKRVNDRIQRDAQDLAQRREAASAAATRAATVAGGAKPPLVRVPDGVSLLRGKIPVFGKEQLAMLIDKRRKARKVKERAENEAAKAKAAATAAFDQLLGVSPQGQSPEASGPRTSGLDIPFVTSKGRTPRSKSGWRTATIAVSEQARKRMQIRRQILMAATKGVVGRYGPDSPIASEKLRKISQRFGGFADFTRGMNAQAFELSKGTVEEENIKRREKAEAKKKAFEEAPGDEYTNAKGHVVGKRKTIVTPFGPIYTDVIKKPKAAQPLPEFKTPLLAREAAAAANRNLTGKRTKYTTLAYPRIGDSKQLLESRKAPIAVGSPEEEAQKAATREANRESRKQMLEAARAEIPLARARESARRQELFYRSKSSAPAHPVSVTQVLPRLEMEPDALKESRRTAEDSQPQSIQDRLAAMGAKAKAKASAPQVPSIILPGAMRYSVEEARELDRLQKERDKARELTPKQKAREAELYPGSLIKPVVKPKPAPPQSVVSFAGGLGTDPFGMDRTLGSARKQARIPGVAFVDKSMGAITGSVESVYESIRRALNIPVDVMDKVEAELAEKHTHITTVGRKAATEIGASLDGLTAGVKVALGGAEMSVENVKAAFVAKRAMFSKIVNKEKASTASATETTAPAAAKTGMVGPFNVADLKKEGDAAFFQMKELAKHLKEFGIKQGELDQLSLKQLQYLAAAVKGGQARTDKVKGASRVDASNRDKAIAIIKNSINNAITDDAIAVAQTPPKTPPVVPAAVEGTSSRKGLPGGRYKPVSEGAKKARELVDAPFKATMNIAPYGKIKKGARYVMQPNLAEALQSIKALKVSVNQQVDEIIDPINATRTLIDTTPSTAPTVADDVVVGVKQLDQAVKDNLKKIIAVQASAYMGVRQAQQSLNNLVTSVNKPMQYGPAYPGSQPAAQPSAQPSAQPTAPAQPKGPKKPGIFSRMGAGVKSGMKSGASTGTGLLQNALSMVIPPQLMPLQMILPQLINLAKRFTKTFSLIGIAVLVVVSIFKFLKSTFGEWKDSAGPFLTNFKAAWTALAGIFTTVKIALGDFFKSFFGGSEKSSGSMQNMGKNIRKVSEVVRDFAIKFARFFNLTIKPALYSFLSGLKLVIQGAMKIFSGIFNFVKGIVQKFQGQGDEAGKSFSKGFEAIKSGFFKVFKGIVKGLAPILILIIRAIEKVATLIVNIFEQVVILVIKAISLLVRGIVNLFFMIPKGLVVIIQQILNLFKELTISLVRGIQEAVRLMISVFFALPRFLTQLVSKMTSIFGGLAFGFGMILDKMSSMFVEWSNKVLDYAKNQDGVFGFILDKTGVTGVTKALKSLTGLIGKGADAVGSVSGKIGEKLLDINNQVFKEIGGGLDDFQKKSESGVDTIANILVNGIKKVGDFGQFLYAKIVQANDGVLSLVDSATGAVIRTIGSASNLVGMLADGLVGWIEKISIGDDISRSMGDDFKGKVKEKVDDALENLDPEAAVAAGEDIANAITEGLKTLKTNFFDKVVDNLGKALEKQKNKITDALNLQKENQLKIFDDQIAAIDALAAAEEKLTATIEFENQKREAEAERALQKKNYEKQRALAIYEGRIDDARTLDQEETKNRKDAEKNLKELETNRNKTLQAENRDTAKGVIAAQKTKAAEAFDADIKAFEEFAAEILAQGTFTQAELEAQFAAISAKATTMSGNMRGSFETFYQAIPGIISTNTDRTVGMFSTDMQKLVDAAKTKFGAENDLANPETILGATSAMLTGSQALFTSMMPNVIAQYSTGVNGLAEINRNFADPKNENSPGKLFEKAISDANEALKREYIKMQTSATSAFAAIVKGINEELNKLAIDTALDAAIEKLQGKKSTPSDGSGGGTPTSKIGSAADNTTYSYPTLPSDLTPKQTTLAQDALSGASLAAGFNPFARVSAEYMNQFVSTAPGSPAKNKTLAEFKKQVGTKGYFEINNRGSLIPSIKEALKFYGYDTGGTSEVLGQAAVSAVASFKNKYGLGGEPGRVGEATADKLGLFNAPGVPKRYYGGPIPGASMVPGATSQAVPAVLHGGEYVINAKAATNLGSSFLDYLNSLKYGLQGSLMPGDEARSILHGGGKIPVSKFVQTADYRTLDQSFGYKLLQMFRENPSIGLGLGGGGRTEGTATHGFYNRYKITTETVDEENPETYADIRASKLKFNPQDGQYYRLKPGQAAVAVPGASYHVMGLAADLVGDMKLAGKIAKDYGLVQVLGTGENWHFQPTGTPKGKRGLDYLKQQYGLDAYKTPLNSRIMDFLDNFFASNAKNQPAAIRMSLDSLVKDFFLQRGDQELASQIKVVPEIPYQLAERQLIPEIPYALATQDPQVNTPKTALKAKTVFSKIMKPIISTIDKPAIARIVEAVTNKQSEVSIKPEQIEVIKKAIVPSKVVAFSSEPKVDAKKGYSAQNLSEDSFKKQAGKNGFIEPNTKASYVSDVKKALRFYGYDVNTSDTLGAAATAAVAQFQSEYGLGGNGKLNLSTARSLGLFGQNGVVKKYYGGPIKRMMGGPVGAYGAGGAVPGFAMKAVPALLHGGEYVVNSKAVQNLGSGFLQYLNNMKYGMPKFSVPTPNMPNVNINQTVNVNGGNSENINNYNFYVDNFIGEDKWFEGMMNEYNVKVVPNKQKSAGLESRVVRSYNGINKGI